VVREVCFTIKGGPLQIRRGSNDATVIFECDNICMFGIAYSTRVVQTAADIDVCAELWSLEVKVPLIFSGTMGFPYPRDGR
jgi:hypothetical protein